MSDLTITNEELVIVKQILQTHIPNLEVWAFGSRVKGNAKPYSDLDLAVITGEPLSLQTHADLVDAFSESDLPWKVDIVDWALLTENFKHVVQSQYMVVQSRK
ncbi:nucleotidyltransferase family protein [Actinobacillus minor]|uniref:nucleotidyltransferase family protein n=1 Tax=Actinobacillus minor TaxID=51047 RepID=UPI0023F0AEDF|nr:nucleotidyltransferase domain-containing protein [Actinobacillus minor]MDD6910520.1 nucleotidyltransferase domain-containing protein [Actinobacillus minor]MDY4713868.1 nucleotidyltransferase domain-containing protein [Actinobacillus minor]